jgi:predicted CopG family antitoxin
MAKLKQNEQVIHEQFSQYGKNAKEWTRKCVLLLPKIEKHQIWKKKGFTCIYEYAAKIAGMNRNSVDDALRILRKIEDKPELMKVAEKKGLNAVRPVATIATQETEKFWADKVKIMAQSTLKTYVREFRVNPRNNPSEISVNQTELTIKLDKELAQKLEKLKGQGSWNDLIKQLVNSHDKQLEQEKPETTRSRSRHIPAKINKYIVQKTNGQCAFPGCTKPHKILHHADRFSITREHNPDRIIPLCFEHERIAHLGLIKNEHLSPEHWKIAQTTDATTYKHIIDQTVQAYRQPG